MCLFFVQKYVLLVRVLRVHSVQSVINNPTQLSGRGFPCIFYINSSPNSRSTALTPDQPPEAAAMLRG